MSVNDVFLSKPNIIYHQSFIEALAQLQSQTNVRNYMEKNLDLVRLSDEQEFAHYLQYLINEAAGEDLNPGRVPHTVYWLMEHLENGETVWQGRVDIRHSLTEYLKRIGGHVGYIIRPGARQQGYGTKLLALTLDKIRSHQPNINTQRVLITCDEDNLGSKKIIEHNGGVFVGYTEQPAPLAKKMRFLIPLG